MLLFLPFKIMKCSYNICCCCILLKCYIIPFFYNCVSMTNNLLVKTSQICQTHCCFTTGVCSFLLITTLDTSHALALVINCTPTGKRKYMSIETDVNKHWSWQNEISGCCRHTRRLIQL